MLGTLKALFARVGAGRRGRIADEYANMSEDERRTADALREGGPGGERARIIEHEADRYIEAEERGPRED